ncbi:SepM family pheromone-processing serine protease [Enterococcus phoeniculicola]|jgi:PDZ domain-containing protein|uniref:PDZ domain-containing protein n=1 Tax=Enterococcus phoeniculicola ATCC BAA-412 TaxID=1158610 RepID=R3W8P1_9ENTE|nr:SepM family pheromone-processing serine protease [Enterococcus phoeniculicola]EOL43852.1 PDZ domain-containing protein [Enterococcus phoeniculicola ATCC BAA-412]EOT76784.1 PDZ domain-containing protein [Enterococcus phoeniculicola ATCC BAA-412]
MNRQIKEDKKAPIRSLIAFLVMLLLAAAIVVPIPYYIEAPGSTINLKELITVDGKTDTQEGSFSLTSVGIRQATVFTALKSKLTPFQDLVSKKELYGTSTDEEYNQMQLYYMQSSQNAAIEQALKLADKPYEMVYKGVYVLSVEENSSFYGKISVGDTVTEADGKSFKSSEEFMEYVKSQKVGQEMTVTYLHEGKEKKATGKLIELKSDKKAGIGIGLVDHTEISSETKVAIDSGSIGGPSAGLMFTLEIYEQVTGKNLRHGKSIAGTGTINSEGTVGRIGGIDKKVASASESGAEIFFAPDDAITDEMKKIDPNVLSNYEEAKAAAEKLGTSMKIVPVKTVQDALNYLEKLNK